MSELIRSKYLEKILEAAKQFIKGDSVTVDAVFLVMVDYVSQMDTFELTAEQSSLKKKIISRCDPDQVKGELKSKVSEQAPSFIDSINYQKVVKKAFELAKKRSKTEVTADVFAECIMESPSSILKECLKSKDSAQEESDKEEEKTDTAVSPLGDGEESSDDTKNTPASNFDKLKKVVEQTKEITKVLSQKIYGQNNAIATFAAGYFQSLMLKLTGDKRNAPAATFLFAGPPGVGKTYLAESVAELLGLPYKRFDMSEYSDKEANLMFCGMDSSYKNAAPGHVTSFVKENPKCVILFDEVEKSHLNIIHLFLQILDAGRVKDNFHAEEVYFRDAIIILTTNAGRSLYEDSETNDFSDVPRKVILNALRKDINPETGAPFFPGAICSRFATGNVVMFNHMDVSTLSTVVKGEMQRNIKEIEESLNVKVSVDENIYTALLFAEGNGIDARTARSRAQSFLEGELFELFRLMTSEKTLGNVSELKKIKFLTDVRKEQQEIYETFNICEKPDALVFVSDETKPQFEKIKEYCNLLFADSISQVRAYLDERDVAFAFVDFTLGMRENSSRYINIEDIDSLGRKCMNVMRSDYSAVPMYIVSCGTHEYSQEERVTFLHHGVRDILEMSEPDAFVEKVKEICVANHSQQKMLALTSRGKVLTFETAQRLNNTDDGIEAEIILFDFETVTAIDPEDKNEVLSNMTRPDVKFDDVIGAEDVKDELKYFAEYLKNPKKYAGTGLRAPKGILLYGPPGTGKTLLAKALAGESDTTFISAEGNQFLKKYIGEGPELVHKMFRMARKYAPAILFIDEIDAIGKSRTGAGGETNADILTAFLAEMDGFKSDPSKPVFVLAATNYDVDQNSSRCIDGALLRRFDRKMYVDLPNKDERTKYIRMKLSSNKAFRINDSLIGNLAGRSIGMSLAELESVIELSLRSAVRTGSTCVTDQILDEAFESYNSGEKKRWSAETMLRTARHESGHTLVYRLTGKKPSYVTIVSRGEYGGYMKPEGDEETFGYNRDDMLGMIRVSMAGRAAEIVYYGNEDGISTGASSDLKHATNVAKAMLCHYGMSDEFGMSVFSEEELIHSEIGTEVRKSVNKMLSQELKNAIKIISENKPCIDALAQALLDNNHLDSDDVEIIIGQYIDLK